MYYHQTSSLHKKIKKKHILYQGVEKKENIFLSYQDARKSKK